MSKPPEIDVPSAQPTSEATKPARRRRAAAASEAPEQPAVVEAPAVEAPAAEEAPAVEAPVVEAAVVEAPAIETAGEVAPSSPPPPVATPLAEVPPAAVTADPMASALKAGQQSLQTQTNALAAYVTLTTQWTQHWQSLFGASLKLQQQIARQVMASASSLGDFTAAFGKKESKDKR